MEYFTVPLQIVLCRVGKGKKKEKRKKKKKAMLAAEYSPETSRVGESGTVVVQTLCKKLLALISRVVEPKFRPGRPFLGPLREIPVQRGEHDGEMGEGGRKASYLWNVKKSDILVRFQTR